MKNISIIGATGSIGSQTIEVLRENSTEFKLLGISTHSNWKKTIDIIKEFRPKVVVNTSKEAYDKIKEYRESINGTFDLYFGRDNLKQVSSIRETDILVTSVVGMVGLEPTLDAIKNGTTIALANKETLVAAGKIVMSEAKRHGVDILPVDSEHNALFQCLKGENIKEVKKLHITASGGPFRGKKINDLLKITPEQAVKHPKWNMGKKISVDSSTLMNKGLEVIEAHWLYGIDYRHIDVVVHPESIIHSMVEFVDNSILAQISNPNMKLPIQFALTYPKRQKCNIKEMNFWELGKLTFEKPDIETFRCLKLAYDAGKTAGNSGVILNTANEVAVDLFLKNVIKYTDIANIVEDSLNKYEYFEPTIEEIIQLDSDIRRDLYNKFIGGN